MAASAPASRPAPGYGSRARWQVSTGAKRSAGLPGRRLADRDRVVGRRDDPLAGEPDVAARTGRRRRRAARSGPSSGLIEATVGLQVAEHRRRRGEHRVDLPGEPDRLGADLVAEREHPVDLGQGRRELARGRGELASVAAAASSSSGSASGAVREELVLERPQELDRLAELGLAGGERADDARCRSRSGAPRSPGRAAAKPARRSAPRRRRCAAIAPGRAVAASSCDARSGGRGAEVGEPGVEVLAAAGERRARRCAPCRRAPRAPCGRRAGRPRAGRPPSRCARAGSCRPRASGRRRCRGRAPGR